SLVFFRRTRLACLFVAFVFCLMSPPPPCPPLFPYTTLFRSGGIYDASITLHEKGPRRISPFFIPGRLINLASGYVSIRFGLKGPDRKSTRLNSSHVKTSYAVFCLKKIKKRKGRSDYCRRDGM